MTKTINLNRGNILHHIRVGPKHYYQSYEQIRYNQERAAKNPLDLFTLITILFMLLLMVLYAYLSVDGNLFDKEILYDDEILAQYTETKYEEQFSASANYENNILLVYLFDKEQEEYKISVRIGENITSEIANLFKGESSFYNITVRNNLHEFFLGGYYGIEDDISEIMGIMYEKISSLNLTSNFIKPTPADSDFVSHLADSIGIIYEQEETSMLFELFANVTGIPIVMVTDYLENVFEVKYTISEDGTIFFVLSGIALVTAIAFITMYLVLRKKRIKEKCKNDEEGIRDKYGAHLGEGIE